MGPTDDRCFCQQNKYTTPDILEPSSGPSSSTTGCLSINLDQEGDVLIPTVEVHTSNNIHNPPTKNTESGTDNSVLANTVLVSDVNTDEAVEPPWIFKLKNWTMVAWRLSSGRKQKR